MKQRLKRLQLLLVAVVASLFFLPQAQASEYGCKALLCFAGGQGVAECVGTIAQVFRDLARGRGFPACSMASGDGNDSTQNYAQVGSIPLYPDCPAGTTPLPDGSRFVTSSLSSDSGYSVTTSAGNDVDGNTLPRACIGGSQTVMYYDDNSNPIYTYDQVVMQQPQYGQEIDVFVQQQLVKRVPF